LVATELTHVYAATNKHRGTVWDGDLYSVRLEVIKESSFLSSGSRKKMLSVQLRRTEAEEVTDS
jgi:hypothetical protein